ncbi:unnamed protein product [Spirodela intermedia]|uniref:Apple domain-containing protein n=1 Tax=Spirodela intermedia TaxID=51605 RepID=A0A7I8IKH2_SPIIN|nr:unnamed protein product [Spirodela intermedia]CAA6658380.1 unnamed protein product [Spirodela intermedia]
MQNQRPAPADGLLSSRWSYAAGKMRHPSKNPFWRRGRATYWPPARRSPEPDSPCDCNAKPPTCICLHGFVPKNQTEWETRTFSSGCVRRVQLQCSKSDKFLPVKRAKLPDRSRMIDKKTELDCRADCISKCQCTAYAYTNTRRSSERCSSNQVPNLLSVSSSYRD